MALNNSVDDPRKRPSFDLGTQLSCQQDQLSQSMLNQSVTSAKQCVNSKLYQKRFPKDFFVERK